MAFFNLGHHGNNNKEHIQKNEQEVSSDAIQEERFYCNQCQIKGLNSVACAFCPACFDFLCPTCNTQHKQLYPGHSVITNDLERCRDYVNLKIQISAANMQLQQTHNEAENNIDLAEKYRNRAIEDVQKERQKINEKFDEQKAKMNSELDELEANIKTEILHKYKTDYEKFMTVMEETDSLKKDIQTLTQNYDSLQQTQSTFFDSLTKCKEELSTIKPKVKQAVVHNGVTKYKFEPKWQQNTMKMTISNLGTIKTLDPLKATADVNFICDINVTSSTDTEFCNIKGMCFLSEHFLVVADSQNKSLKVLDRIQNRTVSAVAMPTTPRDVTQVKDTQIAVTLPGNRMIQVLILSSNNTLSKVKDIPVSGTCRGIVYNKGKLIVSFVFPTSHVQILDMNGTVLKNFDLGHFAGNLEGRSSFAGIGLSPNHKMIYVADQDRDTVTCMKKDGKIKAIYRDSHFEKPRGLAVSSTGFVFVTGKGKVHELSADLSHGRIVLDRSHEIHSAQSLLYCENEKALFVGMIAQNMIKKFRIM